MGNFCLQKLSQLFSLNNSVHSQVLTLIFFKRGPNVLDSSMISEKHLLYIWSLWKFGPFWLPASREDSCYNWQKTQYVTGNNHIIIIFLSSLHLSCLLAGSSRFLFQPVLVREAQWPHGPGSSPGRGHCVVFLGKTLHSHSASLHPGV